MEIISLSIFSAYIIFLLMYVGIKKLPSLSDSFYELNKKRKGLGVLFQIVLSICAVLLIIPLLELIKDNPHFPTQIFAFLCPASLLFTALAPAFKSKDIERKVHMTSAKLSAVCSVAIAVIVSIQVNYYYLLLIPYLAMFFYLFYKVWNQGILFAELFCFTLIYSTLLIS